MDPASAAFQRVFGNPFAYAAFKSTEPWLLARPLKLTRLALHLSHCELRVLGAPCSSRPVLVGDRGTPSALRLAW